MGKTFRNAVADLEDILEVSWKKREARDRKEQRLMKEQALLVQDLTERPMSSNDMLARWG